MKKLFWIIIISSVAFSQSKNANLTLYKDGYALVKQPILFSLSKGKGTISYSSLPDKLELSSPFLSLKGANVIYQRYNYDIFSARKFLKEHIGKIIEVTPNNDKSYKGTLLEVGENLITISSKNSVRIFNFDKITEMKISGEEEKKNLNPKLSWEIRVKKGGKIRGELIYLSQGFEWKTGYRLIISTDENTGSLITEAVIINNTNMDFENARLQLVEGSLKRVYQRKSRAMPSSIQRGKFMTMDSEGIPSFAQEDVADYKIYKLSEPLRFPKYESITASLYPERKIKIARLYKFENSERSSRNEPLTVHYSFVNSEENNLNIPLPGGIIQIYQTRKSSIEFTGEDRLKQVPVGEEAEITAGRAFDVLGKRTVVNYDRKKKSEEAIITVEVKNIRKDEISVQLIEHIYGDWVIKNPSHNYKKTDAQTIQFDLKIAPKTTELVSYTYRKEWK